jgi:hypothetical protein
MLLLLLLLLLLAVLLLLVLQEPTGHASCHPPGYQVSPPPQQVALQHPALLQVPRQTSSRYLWRSKQEVLRLLLLKLPDYCCLVRGRSQ